MKQEAIYWTVFTLAALSTICITNANINGADLNPKTRKYLDTFYKDIIDRNKDKSGSLPKCYSCTERTDPAHCLDGTTKLKGDCIDGIHDKDSCIKFKFCISGIPCSIYRGCLPREISVCMKIIQQAAAHHGANFKVEQNKCSGKHKFKLSTALSNSALACMLKLKFMYEDFAEALKITLEEPSMTENIELQAAPSDDKMEMLVEYCHCSEQKCNEAVTPRSCAVMLFGVISLTLTWGFKLTA